MAFTFDSLLLEHIQSAVDAVNDSDDGNWLPAYQAVVDALDIALAFNLVSAADRPYVDAVHVWFRGALKVNSGEGGFSTFIRNYTLRQMQLHLGEGYTEENVASLMQAASNEIGRYVIENGILNFNEDGYSDVLPQLGDIAMRDAQQALGIVFAAIDDGDSAVFDGISIEVILI